VAEECEYITNKRQII